MRTSLAATLLAAVAGLAGCGAGDEDVGPPPPAALIAWNGNSNGSVILDGANRRFAVRAQDRAVVDLETDRTLAGAQVDAQARLVANGTVLGGVFLVAGTNNSRVAVFGCAGGDVMLIPIDAGGWRVQCDPAVTPTPGVTTSVGAGADRRFIVWSGSVNGSYVLDSSGDSYQFDSGTAALYDPSTGTDIGNLLVDRGSAALILNGSAIGSVQLRPAQGGGQVAMLVCAGGALMDIALSGGRYSVDCGGTTMGGMAPPPPSTGAASSGVTFSQRGRYITTTVPNQFEVSVSNASAFAIACSVYARYSYPNGRGSLDSDRRTQSLSVPAGATRSTVFGLIEMNLRMDSYEVVCQRA